MNPVPTGATPWGPLSAQVLRHALDTASPDHILDVAATLFARQGISATTMRQIAITAGLSRAWLYRKYPSRDLIVQAVLLREGARTAATLIEADDPDTPTVAAVTRTVVHVIYTLRTNPLLRRILDTEREMVSAYLTADSGPLLASAAGSLESYLRNRAGLTEQHSRIAAETIVRLIISIGLMPNALLDFDQRDQVQEFIERVIPPFLDATNVEDR